MITTGYNGAPRGLPHCDVAGHLLAADGCCTRDVHAELNVLAQAARYGLRVDGAALYVTHAPCFACIKPLINAGIREVIYDVGHGLDPRVAVTFLASGGIFSQIDSLAPVRS